MANKTFPAGDLFPAGEKIHLSAKRGLQNWHQNAARDCGPLQHSTESASIHRDRRRALTEIPVRVVVKERRWK
jgi:hypothetical protein